MFESIDDEIKNFIEDEGRDLKYKPNDEIRPLNFDCSPSIAYDYLELDTKKEFSFFNTEINNSTSEEFPALSDAQIYFMRIKNICKNSFDNLNDEIKFFKLISPNKKLRKLFESIFAQKLQAEQLPQFIEIILYTNKKSNKAPRIFGFIGNANIIYILFYDPFHEIFNKTGKI